MSFPRLTATPHEIQQTRRICELRGWPYYSSTDARTDDAHVFDRAGQEETLVAGRFTLEHVVMMLKDRGWVYSPNMDYVSGDYYGDDLQGYFKLTDGIINHRYEDTILSQDEHPHDLSAAMKALITIEERKENK